MKKTISIVALAVLVVLAGLVWVVSRNQRNSQPILASVPSRAIPAPQPAPIQVFVLPPSQALAPAASVDQLPADNEIDHHVEADADLSHHIAQPGETVSGLASRYFGQDTPSNRNAIINANASLKTDPDKLIAGRSYRIPTAAEAAVAASAPQLAAAEAPARKSDANDPEPATELKYTAAAGDTLTNLAHAFLGSGSQAHQDEIANANSSLQKDANHVVAGKAYRIPAPNGLSAGATQAPAETTSRPATEPDSDDIVAANATRSLRYTARPGDTVTTMATELLGSDTQETRDAIINENPSLKAHPDRVIAGHTYWIPAPVPAE